MAKARSVWRCQNCGASAPRWMGRCSDCGEFGSFVEEIEQPARASRQAARLSAQTFDLDAVGAQDAPRTSTGIPELGLTGQVRPVAQAAARLRESIRLGMRRIVGHAPASLDAADAAGLLRVATIADALDVLR